MADDRPFVIESPTRVRLGPTAKEWAREWGWSDAEMACYLLKQDALHEAGIDASAITLEEPTDGPEIP